MNFIAKLMKNEHKTIVANMVSYGPNKQPGENTVASLDVMLAGGTLNCACQTLPRSRVKGIVGLPAFWLHPLVAYEVA